MQDRIITFQEQPYEGLTNYIVLAAARINFNVQHLGRVPKEFVREHPLPSLGPRADWSWMSQDIPQKHLTFPELDANTLGGSSWHEIFCHLAQLPHDAALTTTEDVLFETLQNFMQLTQFQSIPHR